MKKIISIAFLMCILFLGNVAGQQISAEFYNKEVIHEDFNQVADIFKIVTTTDNYFILDNGDYLLSRNNGESEYAIIAKNSSVSDFVLKTAIRIGPSNNKRASVGIILKAQQSGKGAIVFEINKKGQYRIKQLQGNTYSTLSGNKKNNGWVKSKIINGEDEHNFVEIRSENNIYDVHINNNYLTSFFIPDYTTGACGLIISSATKARVSYYYINSQGDSPIVASYVNENTIDQSELVEELYKKIKILEKNNAQLNKLNSEVKGNQYKEINNLSVATTELEDRIKVKEDEIEVLNSTINKLKNSNISSNTKTKQLNKQIISIKQQLSIERAVNAHLVNDLNNSTSKNTNISTQSNEKIKTLQTELDALEKVKRDLSAKLSSEKDTHTKTKNRLSKDVTKKTAEITALETQLTKVNERRKVAENENATLNITIDNLNTKLTSLKNTHTKTKNGLSKAVTNKSTEIKLLGTQLNKINKELSTLRKRQEEHNAVKSGLKKDNAILYATIDNLNIKLTSLKEELSELKTTNTDLKDLFILKDFEVNGVKPSELTEITTTYPSLGELVGNEKIYAVQFGVYMTIQPYTNLKGLDEVWYETTEHGAYVYLSGQFKSPQEATAHKNTLVTLGYPNAFVVTLTK